MTAELTHEKIYLVSTTHWDREWRFTQEKTRYYLVEMMDSLLDILDTNPDYHSYNLDGQALILEDYLKIRPENRDRLAKYMREGRIQAGPFYMLADESYLHGESLIRNLHYGREVTGELGNTMQIAYKPGGWGQVSQLPQVLSQFGIDSAMFYRGINGEVCPESNYIWASPDGTEILGFKFTDYARASFFFYVYRAAVYRKDKMEIYHDWEDGAGKPFMLCDGHSETCFDMQRQPTDFDPARLKECVLDLDNNELRGFTTRYGLAMQCDDSLSPFKHITDIVDEVNNQFGRTVMEHTSLPAYKDLVIEEMKQTGKFEKLVKLTGEMRHTLKEGVWTDLYPDVISTRVDLKIRNRSCEQLLANATEPFSAFAAVLGKEYPQAFMKRAWKTLLLNHTHDSIGGCSMDKVHKDNLYRYQLVEQIGLACLRGALGHIYDRIDLSSISRDKAAFIAFNPTQNTRSEVSSTYVYIPAEIGPYFVIRDAESNKAVDYAVEEPWETMAILQNPVDIPRRMKSTRYRISLDVKDIPSYGYRTFIIEPSETPAEVQAGKTDDPTMENEYLKITFNPNGTFDVTQKKTGKVIPDMHHFSDIGEAGDPWVAQLIDADNPITSLEQKATIEVVAASDLAKSVRVTVAMQIPASVSEDRKSRSAETLEYTIASVITLRRGSMVVDVETSFDNVCKDHYLRVHIPTDVTSDKVYAESLYDVVERPIPLQDGTGWREKPSRRQPFLNFVDINNGDEGVAFLSTGTPMYEAFDNERTELVVTLLKSYTYWNAARLATYPDQKDSQCLWPDTRRYGLYFHEGDHLTSDVAGTACCQNQALLWGECAPGDKGELPLSTSFVSVDDNDVRIMNIKKSFDDKYLAIRLVNYAAHDKSITLKTFMPIKGALLSNAAEEPGEPVSADGNCLPLSLGRKQIQTVLLSI